jgi:hypothetical protein
MIKINRFVARTVLAVLVIAGDPDFRMEKTFR